MVRIARTTKLPSKSADTDFLGRFREVISDPLNLLIDRVPMAAVVQGTEVAYLHNRSNKVSVTGQDAYYGLFSRRLGGTIRFGIMSSQDRRS